MTELASIAQDLAFVRKRIQRSNRQIFPSSILYLWAGIIMVGSLLGDLMPQYTGLFWLTGAPIGGLLSAFLGRRWALTRGQDDRDDGYRHALHWGALLVGMFALLVPIGSGTLDGNGIGALPLLLVSLAYFYAGLHMSRSLMWLAGIQFLAYLIVSLAPALPQTLTGVFIAVGFVWVGVIAGRPGEPTPMLRLEQ